MTGKMHNSVSISAAQTSRGLCSISCLAVFPFLDIIIKQNFKVYAYIIYLEKTCKLRQQLVGITELSTFVSYHFKNIMSKEYQG